MPLGNGRSGGEEGENDTIRPPLNWMRGEGRGGERENKKDTSKIYKRTRTL